MDHKQHVVDLLRDGRERSKVEITRHLRSSAQLAYKDAQAVLYEMVRNKTVVWNGKMGREGRYHLSPQAIATPLPPLGGRAGASGGRGDPENLSGDDVSDDDVETVVWNRLRRHRRLSALTSDQITWMARRGFLKLSDRGLTWYRSEN